MYNNLAILLVLPYQSNKIFSLFQAEPFSLVVLLYHAPLIQQHTGESSQLTIKEKE